ncbi:hypothetical protein EDB86DRAFT_3083145 [Lactarius hatsudake]|nr:hypothetical protein EDB86DRAFT_3083145 [Lactarius hatsudake]
MYFTKDGRRGIILLARCLRPPPALGASPHSKPSCVISTPIPPRREIAAEASGSSPGGSSNCARHVSKIWAALARDIGGARNENSVWTMVVEDGSDGYEYTHASPTLHLPYLLRVLGPSSLTLYKHVLCRLRILIYTQPPVEAACFLCHVVVDMRFEDQTTPAIRASPILPRNRRTDRGWIACTTDAVSLHSVLLRLMAQQQYQWNMDRGISGRGPGPRASGPGAHLRYVRKETASMGAGRRTAHTTTMLASMNSSDEDEDGAVLMFHAQTRFLHSRLATVLSVHRVFSPRCAS